MSDKCETLVQSRTVMEGDGRPGYGYKKIIHLREPEACGEPGMRYEVRAKRRKQRKGREDGPQQKLMGVSEWYIDTGDIAVTQVFCDKHRRKAEREGKELRPVTVGERVG